MKEKDYNQNGLVEKDFLRARLYVSAAEPAGRSSRERK